MLQQGRGDGQHHGMANFERWAKNYEFHSGGNEMSLKIYAQGREVCRAVFVEY